MSQDLLYHLAIMGCAPAKLLPLVFLLSFLSARALDNGLAQTPPMAYSTWNFFNDNVNETLIQQLADALVETGLADLGYNSMNIDAGYITKDRHPVTNKLQVNTTKFPNGMRAIADYLNAKHLKLGVYTDIGNGSCGLGPGSWGYYDTDADTFANDWHADYLKVDFCGFGQPFTFEEWLDPRIQLDHFRELRDALNATGRQIYYSICPHAHVPKTGPSEPW
jgi:alpha-galactosidase